VQHGEELSPAPPAAELGRATDEDDEPRERPVNLRLRAVPLLDMLDTAIRQQSDMLWEQA
jgi:Domain of unknown function (DUF1840)